MLSSTEPAAEVRTAEIIGTLCLATDLGMGFPFEHGLQTTVIAMRLADALGVDRETAVQTYYASLLAHAGCTTDAHVHAQVFGSSMTENFNPLMTAPCERSSPVSFDRYRILAPQDRHGPRRWPGVCHG